MSRRDGWAKRHGGLPLGLLLAASGFAFAFGCDGAVGGMSPVDGDAAPRVDGGGDGGVVMDAGAADADAGFAVRPEDADLGPFVLDDLVQGERLRHPVVRISGRVDASEAGVSSFVMGDAHREWPLAAGRFKALVRLSPGDNVVYLSAGAVTGTLHLVYEPQQNPRRVRLLYLLAADGDGTFQAPAGEPGDRATARARIGLGGELLQTYVADSMAREGLGRRTFRLERGADGLPVVEEFRSTLTTAELHGMDGLELWYQFYEELGALPDRDVTIDVAIMAFTRYDGETGTLLAHTALGGGRLGLFASGSLHTWAGSLDEVALRFTDERVVDTTMSFDDSASRGTFWANYATTLGATLHELGHCLSLPHPTVGGTIMARGFDHLNRSFVSHEPSSAASAGLPVVAPEDEPGWHDGNAARLRYHRWLEQDDVGHTSDTPPTFSATTATVRVASGAGLRQIGYHVGGDIAGFEHFEDAPRATFDVDLAAMRAAHGAGARLRVTAIDDQGNIGESEEITL